MITFFSALISSYLLTNTLGLKRLHQQITSLYLFFNAHVLITGYTLSHLNQLGSAGWWTICSFLLMVLISVGITLVGHRQQAILVLLNPVSDIRWKHKICVAHILPFTKIEFTFLRYILWDNPCHWDSQSRNHSWNRPSQLGFDDLSSCTYGVLYIAE